MKTKNIIIAVVSSLLVANANAATFLVSNVINGTTDTLYVNADGSPNTGGIATIGYFSSGYTITGVAATDIAAYTIVSSATIGGNAEDLGGAFAGFAQSAAVDVGSITTGNALLGRTIYSFVGNQAALASSTAHILVAVGSISNDVPFVQAYSSNPVGLIPVSGYGQVGPALTGDFGGQGVGTFASLQFVPEPSTAALGAIGALFLLRRRRN